MIDKLERKLKGIMLNLDRIYVFYVGYLLDFRYYFDLIFIFIYIFFIYV